MAQKKVTVTFVPHLIPMDRGILTTLYLMLTKKWNTEEVLNAFQEYYQKEPFVRIYPKGKFPNTKDVRGSNYCDIGVKVNEVDGQAVVVTTD